MPLPALPQRAGLAPTEDLPEGSDHLFLPSASLETEAAKEDAADEKPQNQPGAKGALGMRHSSRADHEERGRKEVGEKSERQVTKLCPREKGKQNCPRSARLQGRDVCVEATAAGQEPPTQSLASSSSYAGGLPYMLTTPKPGSHATFP